MVLARIEFGSSTMLGTSHMAGPGSADQTIDIWWIAWAQFALSHGRDLFFSNCRIFRSA
jgi:hypothetical protein